MKRLVAILFLLCAFAGAQPAFASGGGGGEKGETQKKAKAPKKPRPITSLKSWVMVDPFAVSIIQDGRIRGRFRVSFGMDVPDDALRGKAEALMPRLRDVWLSELTLFAATMLRQRRPADIAAVSDLLQSSADRVLGKPGSKVLLAAVTVAMTP
jgi:hypothetical protein